MASKKRPAASIAPGGHHSKKSGKSVKSVKPRPSASSTAVPLVAKAANKPSLQAGCVFVCAGGAGGGFSRQEMLAELGKMARVHFTGAPNLTSSEREEPFLKQFVAEAHAAARRFGSSSPMYLVGHSFGSRAAVHLWARGEYRRQLPRSCRGIIAFGYPLMHPTQRREQKLLELPESTKILFISGTRDSFAGDFSLLETTLGRAACGKNCRVVKVEGGDHGLKCRKSLEETALQTVREALTGFLK
ncbi:unnamed protein product [Polarella glacialis]|uniref:KANL3/Tex30 alpha/beta hydrolase-like domain-containing protein n=1 Tax=Polarella glacialis TaxID=89957 RepID=A0A813GLU4_POLGL|nr:unnamed protein product [Polarella glacialis]